MSATEINQQSELLNALPDAVILLNAEREVVFANKAATELLEGNYLERDLSMSFRFPPILEAVRDVLEGAESRDVEFSTNFPVQRNFEVRVTRYAEPENSSDSVAMVLLHDVSSQKLAEQMRQDFVANVSHELRSPIASLIGFIETLQGPAKGDPDAQERFLTIMSEESQRMARMIDDLLSLSRVEASERIRPQNKVDVSELLNMTRELLTGRADQRDMEIEFMIAENLPQPAGDRDELMEVFQNLIDNAIKYGRGGTPIKIVAESVDRIPEIGGEGLAIMVENEGEGIAAEQIPRLTERFYRVDKGRSRKMGGTGLGLAIVKHIVNRHRGRLAIESTLEKSTKFTVFLPV